MSNLSSLPSIILDLQDYGFFMLDEKDQDVLREAVTSVGKNITGSKYLIENPDRLLFNCQFTYASAYRIVLCEMCNEMYNKGFATGRISAN